MTSLRFSAVALALPLLLLVSGCTASNSQSEAPSSSPSATIADDPTPSATPVETSTPTPDPTESATPTPAPSNGASLAVSVEIGGSSIRVLGANKTTLADIDYKTNPAKAIAAMEKALGEKATLSTSPNYTCEASHKIASWGKGFTLNYDRGGLAGKAKIYFNATSKTTSGGVKIVTPDGWGVGSLLGAILKADPATQHERYTAHVTAVYYDVAHGSAADKDFFGTFYGAYAQSYDGRIKALLSPTYYYEDC